MSCGLFGKLPAKRDFIALNAPSGFLAGFEKWLQGGVTASRLELGERWQAAYLNAPIWRFWLGGAHCGGQAVTGAFMPSVDGVGRYFPLTVFASAAPGAPLPPPELDPQDAWFGTIEDVLLQALEPAMRYETLAEQLSTLPGPSDRHLPEPPRDMLRLSDGTIVGAATSAGLPERLAALRVEDHTGAYSHACYLWTVGGPSFEPLVLVGQSLPAPHLFAGLLTGRFDAHLPSPSVAF